MVYKWRVSLARILRVASAQRLAQGGVVPPEDSNILDGGYETMALGLSA